MFLFPATLAISAGGILVMQRLLNASLGTRIGGMKSSFVNHLVGTLFALALLTFGLGNGNFKIAGIPIHYFMGGCFGVFTVYLANLAVVRIGAMVTSICLTSSQLLTSAIIDHFGLFGGQAIENNSTRIIGMLLIFVGAIMASKKKKLSKVLNELL
ncbi:MAG: DMT family transporter [Pseudomonadota bacterium]